MQYSRSRSGEPQDSIIKQNTVVSKRLITIITFRLEPAQARILTYSPGRFLKVRAPDAALARVDGAMGSNRVTPVRRFSIRHAGERVKLRFANTPRFTHWLYRRRTRVFRHGDERPTERFESPRASSFSKFRSS